MHEGERAHQSAPYSPPTLAQVEQRTEVEGVEVVEQLRVGALATKHIHGALDRDGLVEGTRRWWRSSGGDALPRVALYITATPMSKRERESAPLSILLRLPGLLLLRQPSLGRSETYAS